MLFSLVLRHGNGLPLLKEIMVQFKQKEEIFFNLENMLKLMVNKNLKEWLWLILQMLSQNDRVQHERKNGIWYVAEGTLPTYTVEEVYKGLEANPNVLSKNSNDQ